ncbi:hypothetical protein [Longimicrobium sp.]|uniref:hypothetical protein n=1 Tax=Longimicrobium sp. TaxID=2029185 RepID=UPI002E35652F|nr:hypothetical protein [Longimicrobium sp.]HEX6041875.1 hypothetical protein [Longimicrobium sp.]
MGHLTKWLFFNLGFGAIPYALVVALNRLQTPGVPLLHPSSEMLFIALASTSSALAELWDGEDHWPPRSRGTHPLADGAFAGRAVVEPLVRGVHLP